MAKKKRIADPLFIVVDLFCGAGGTTTGFEMSNGMSKVIACVNHDPNAIKSHWLNHPDVVHFEEDIRTLQLGPLLEIVNKYRKLYPNAKLILWASLECTNFSKAKGGMPRDADSRTLADELQRYIVTLNPDIVQIENVVEFMSWGPLVAKTIKTAEGYECCEVSFIQQYENVLDETGDIIILKTGKNKGAVKQQLSNKYKTFFHGFPESKTKGTEFIRWRKEICELGYVDEWKQLNAANYGAYTSRNRLFGMFSKQREMITFPEPTHSKNPSGKMFTGPKKWKPVKEVLDFSDEGNSIFGRKKDLSPKTLERIYAGLVKYVAGGDEAFIAKYFSGNPDGKVKSINSPAGTITTIDHHCLVQSKFLMNYHHSSDVNSIDSPCPTLVTRDKLAYVNTSFLTKYHGKGVNICSVQYPASTISTKDRLAKIQPLYWMDRNFNNGGGHQPITQPAGTILSVPKLNLIKCDYFKTHSIWLDKQYSGSANHQSVNQPAGSILANDKHSLIHAEKFIMDTNYNNVGSDIESPAPTITASRRHHYLMNPQWGINGNSSVEKPCFTLIARMDKAPPYIVTTECGQIAIEIYETDSPIMVKIKRFMAAFAIIDIKMRMLKILELLKIQGFPYNYILHGTQTDQKKFIGNSVHPKVVIAWIITIAKNYFKEASFNYSELLNTI